MLQTLHEAASTVYSTVHENILQFMYFEVLASTIPDSETTVPMVC
jgi:hypothetical protein